MPIRSKRRVAVRRITGVIMTFVSLPALLGAEPALALVTARRVAADEQARRRVAYVQEHPAVALRRDILPRLAALRQSISKSALTPEQRRELRKLASDLETARAALRRRLAAPSTAAARISARRILARIDADIAFCRCPHPTRPSPARRPSCRRTRECFTKAHRSAPVSRPVAGGAAATLPKEAFPAAGSIPARGLRSVCGTLLDISRIPQARPRTAALADVFLPHAAAIPDASLSGPPTAADLAVTAPQTSRSDHVRTLAEELQTPVRIFEHFRNRFIYEPYFGAVKGADRTLTEGAGNDVDLASALISVLRAAGIPCRYVYGVIRLTRDQAAAWLGVDPEYVPELLAAAEIPHRIDGDAPDSDILLDHVWVAAWIDYLPYRGNTRPEPSAAGTPGAHGDFWIELDPSFKQHTFTPASGVRTVEADLGIDTAAFLTNVRAASTRAAIPANPGLANASAVPCDDNVALLPQSRILNEVADLAQRTADRMTHDRLTLENLFRERVIVDETYGLLPCTDLYRIERRGAAWSAWPEALSARVTLTVTDRFGRTVLEYEAPQADLLKHSLTLAWTPASETDHDVVREWRDAGSDEPFPAWQVRVLPRLLRDDQTVVQGELPIKLGQASFLEWRFPGAATDPAVFPTVDAARIRTARDVLPAGALAAFVFDAGRIPFSEVMQAAAELDARSADLATFLRAAGLAWFYQADRFSVITAGLLDLYALRRPSLVRASIGFDIQTLYDMPFTVIPDTVEIAVVLDEHALAPLSTPTLPRFPTTAGVPEAEAQLARSTFPFLSALLGSVLGANALERMTGAPAASPLSLLAAAAVGANAVVTLKPDLSPDGVTPSNPLDRTALDNLGITLSDPARNRIVAELNLGNTVAFVRNALPEASRNLESVIAVSPNDGAADLLLLDADAGAVRTASALAAPDAPPADVPDLLDPDSPPSGPANLATTAAAALRTLEDAATSTGIAYVPTVAHIKNALALASPGAAGAPAGPARLDVCALDLATAAIALWGRIDQTSKRPAILDVQAEPDAFSPNNDGVRDAFALSATAVNTADWTIRITDAVGRVLRTFTPADNLGADAGNPAVIHVRWDGKNDSGALAADGRYRWTITARGAGTASLSDSVVLDAAPPTAELRLEQRTDHGVTVFAFRGTADDANIEAWTLELCDASTDAPAAALDPADLLPVTGNLPVADGRFLTVDENRLPNGTFYARLTVADKAGNTTLARTAGTFTVRHPVPDNTPPEITVSGAPADPQAGVLRGKVQVAVSAADDGGVAAIELRIDGTVVASVKDGNRLDYTLDCTALADGVHTIEARATDAAGNTARSPTKTFLTSRIVPDLTPPALAIDAPEFATAASPAHLTVRAVDNQDLARIAVLVDGTVSAERTFDPDTVEGVFETDLDPALVTGGAHRIEVQAEDRSGNRTAALLAVNRTDTPDDAPPAVTLTTSADSATGPVTGPIQVHATAADASGIRRLAVLLDGIEIAAVNASLPAVLDAAISPEVLGDGEHAIVARAVDVAGNLAESAPRHVTTDNPVRRFTVTPERLTPGLPTQSNITIGALLREAADWRIRFHGPASIPEITGHSAVIHQTVDLTPYRDGNYTVELVVRGLTDRPSRTFAKDLATGPPLAEFANLDLPQPLADGSQPPLRIRDGLLDLEGTADDPDADDSVSWKIELRKPDGTLVRNLTPHPDADGWHPGRVLHDAGDVLPPNASRAFGTIDFTLVPNGAYQLVLTVRGGADSATTSVPVALDSRLKVGAFRFSQQDLAIPFPGLSIVVVRSYDSIAANAGQEGDFGPGWFFALTDIRLELDEQRTMTRDTDGVPFSKRSGGGRNVTINLPDGRRATFLYTLEPAGWFTYQAVWKAGPGVHATLEPACSAKLIALPGLAPYWEAAGPATPMDNFEFPGFILTMKDGTRYVIDREDTGAFFEDAWTADAPYIQTWGKARLRRIQARNGVRLEVRADGSGIDRYNAAGEKTASVVFQRDAAGRISAVYARSALDANGNPAGPPTVRYTYDADGNLARVERLVDRSDPNRPVYRTIEYLYENPDFPHYITRIKDPRGIAPLRTEIDADGRLVALVDALGRRIELDHNLADHVETVTDRLGNPTTYVYDARGNVIETIDAYGNRTTRTYDDAGNELSVTDPLGHTITSTYDADGNRISITDPLGNTTTKTYDACGNVLSTTDPLGNTTTNTYDDNGNLVAVTDPLGNTTHTRYDANGNPTAWFDAEGNQTAAFAFDPDGNLASVTDAAGLTRFFSYDADGNQTGTRWTWINPDDPSDVRTIAAQAVYDAAGQLVETVDPDGNSSRTEYNALGKPKRITDKFGNTTEMTYDARGNLIQTLYSDGTLTRTVYDGNGRAVVTTRRTSVPGGPGAAPPASVVFPVATHTVYDALGRAVRTEQLENAVIEITDQGAPACPHARFAGADSVISTTRNTYDAAGRLIESVDAAGAVTRYEYDAAGRRTAVMRLIPSESRDGDPELISRTEFEYDAAGRQILVRDARGAETRFIYDALGRRIQTVFPDGSTSSVTYDTRGRRIAETDPNGHTTNFEYDVQGRLTAVILPPVEDPETGNLVRPRYECEYDDYGRLRSITDPKGRTTRFTYDALGRRTSRTLPMGQTETSHYNRFGQLTHKFDFKGRLTRFVYDHLGRLVARQYFSIAALQGLAFPDPLTGARSEDMPALPDPDEETAFTFDALGRRTRITEHRLITPAAGGPPVAVTRRTDLTYDQRDRVVQITSPEGTIHYEYDPGTNRRTRTWTANTDVRYAYDALGRLIAVTACKLHGAALNEPLTTTYSYTSDDRKDAVILPNGVATLYTRDRVGRLTNLSRLDAAGELLASFDYTLGPDGRRNAVHEKIRLPDNTLADVHTRYTYDALNRLIREETNSSTAVIPSFRTDYTYDACGNRVRLETDRNPDGLPETIRFAYNDNDQLVSETSSLATKGATVYDYDANGSLTSKRNATTGESATYTWNLRNRLSRAVIHRFEKDAAGDEHSVDITASYLYDDGGFRVARDIRLSVDGAAPFDRSRTYLPDAGNPTGYTQAIEESTTGGLDRSYIIGDRILGQSDAAGVAWMLPDGHGSTRLLTDAAGAVTDRFWYDAWGNLRTPQPTSVNLPRTPHLYTGEHFDSELGLEYLRARWYAPRLAAFTRMDPYPGSPSDPLSLHRYAYTGNDPINAADPSGLISFSLSELTSATSLSMTLGASFGGVIGVHVTGTLRGALAGVSAGAALGAAASIGGVALLVKTVLLGIVQGILTVVQDYLEHSSLQARESFLQGFSTGAWSQVLGVVGIFGRFASQFQAALVAAVVTGVNSLIDDVSDRRIRPGHFFLSALKAGIFTLMTFGIVQSVIPQEVTVEVEDAFVSFLGAYVGTLLPVVVYDVVTFIGWWREWYHDVG